MWRRSSSPIVVVCVGAILLVATACSDDDSSAPDSEAATPSLPASTPTTDPRRESDGELTIGVFLPRTGAGATIGNSGFTAAQLAVDEINAAGGIVGEPVNIVTEDEGESVDGAIAGIESLLDQDVDAIVGPASSAVAIETIDGLMEAGVVVCSPTASAIALDNHPDRDLFFRTAPSDSLGAHAIALQAQRTGVTSATVVYVDDAYGRPFARAVMDALEDRRLEVRDSPLAADEADINEQASALAQSESGTIIILADAERGWAMLAALGDVLDQFNGGAPPRVLINDAMRVPPSTEVVTALPEPLRTAIEGVSPLANPQEPEEPVGPFATNSFDCVNLVALAAMAADSDDPMAIADQIRAVAEEGADCRFFDECADHIVNGRDVNYNGPGGVVEIAADGDPGRARFRVFTFDELGLSEESGPISISG